MLQTSANAQKDYLIGCRIIRGPGWEWDDQDGGDCHLGTVEGKMTKGNIEGVVQILWDNGRRNQYRSGREGQFDLRLVDNAPAGIDALIKSDDP